MEERIGRGLGGRLCCEKEKRRSNRSSNPSAGANSARLKNVPTALETLRSTSGVTDCLYQGMNSECKVNLGCVIQHLGYSDYQFSINKPGEKNFQLCTLRMKAVPTRLNAQQSIASSERCELGRPRLWLAPRLIGKVVWCLSGSLAAPGGVPY
jgi:hypothetical protein